MERSLVLITPSIVTQGEKVFGTMFWMTVVSNFCHCDVLKSVTDAGRLKKKESNNGTKVGFMVQVAEELKRLLREQVECGQVSAEIAASVSNDVSSFEWLAHVHELFHMRLMNMNYQVGAKTIDR